VKVGTLTYRYIFRGDPELLSHPDRYYNLWYETLLVRLQYADDTRAIYLTRHRVNFLCLALGVFFFFLTARRLLRDWKAALLAAVFLGFSPRIFADGFYNTKDIPFLAFFCVSSFTLLSFLRRQNALTTLAHALATALLVTLRMAGLMVVGFSLVGLAAQGTALMHQVKLKGDFWRGWLIPLSRLAGWGALYGSLALAGIVALLPSVWQDPVGGLVAALREAGNFPWGGSVLYFGSYIPASNLPWHYLLVWIGITTPPLVLLGLVVGAAVALKDLFAPGAHSLWSRGAAALALGWGFLPLFMVILLCAVVYDGWRHLFFAYPGLVLLAVGGLRVLWRFVSSHGRWLRAAAVSAGLILLLQPAAFMLRYHPTQNLYFNFLAAPGFNLPAADLLLGLPDMQVVKERFETDYWGLTYRPLFDELLRRDDSPVISLYPAQYVGRHAYLVLPESERRRLRLDGDESAVYFLTNYRGHIQDYPFPDEVFSYWVGNAKMATIFKIR
jgi:hypothetical protein